MDQCLVLTPSMQLHQILPWYESICAWYKGAVDVLEEYDETVSSPTVTIQIPAVARLRRAPPREKRDVKFSRVNVYQRDDHRCQYCGVRKRARELTYDHVIPRARGGLTNFENIVTCCVRCNSKKDSRTPEEAGMRLLKLPRKPRTLAMVMPIVLPREVPSLWLPYLGGFAAAEAG